MMFWRKKKDTEFKNTESGNVFFTLFGAAAVVSALGLGSVTLIKGPITGMVKSNQQTLSEMRMEVAARLLMQQAAIDGNDDADSLLEPPEYDATSSEITGGGWIPSSYNINDIDPWKRRFAYCVWDNGATAEGRNDAGAGAENRLNGQNAVDNITIALVSAGPNGSFETGCYAYGDGGSEGLVKPADSDDLVTSYTYAQARDTMGDLWVFNTDSDAGTDTVLATERNLEFGDDVTFGGLLNLNRLGGGLLLPDQTVFTDAACNNAARDNELRLNATTSPPSLEICDGTGTFTVVSGDGGSGGGPDTTSDLIGRWTLNDTDGTAIDTGSGSNDGSMQNGLTGASHSTMGRVGNAIDFEFDNSHFINLGSAGSLDNLDPVTITAWINPEALNGTTPTIFSSDGGANGDGYSLRLSSTGALEFFADFNGGSDLTVNSTTTLTMGEWYHVAVTWDASVTATNVRLYLNGSQVGYNTQTDGVGTLDDSANNKRIGNHVSDVNHFDGIIDDVRLYERELEATDIKAIYDANTIITNSYSPDFDYNHTAYAWGWGSGGNKLGDDLDIDADEPVSVTGGTGFRQVAAHNQHSCAIRGDGKIFCWGQGDEGQIGNSANSDQDLATEVSTIEDAAYVSVGSNTSCAVNTSGMAYCWGQDRNGMLGTNGGGNANTPQQVDLISNFIKIETAYSHSCGLTANGRIYCWGDNTNGRNGLNGATDDQPALIDSTFTDFVDLDVNNENGCGLRSNGDVWCWGNDSNGQLGQGAAGGDQDSPVKVDTTEKFIKITVGLDHVCGLKDDGTAYCWGDNTNGQIGNNDSGSDVLEPTQVANITDFVDLSAGATHTCGLISTGQLYCWGNGGDGRLGNNGTAASNTPSLVTQVSSFTDIAAGNRYTVAAAKAATEGSNTTAEAPYTITQKRSSEETMDSYGLSIEMNSTTADQNAGIGFSIDATTNTNTDTMAAAITAVRKGSDGYGGLRFDFMNSGGSGLNNHVYMDPDGDIRTEGDTSDVYASLETGVHSPSWPGNYHYGMLATDSGAGTPQLAFFGFESDTGSTVIMGSKDILIESSNDTGSALNTVLKLEDGAADEFYGDVDLTGAGNNFDITAYSDTAADHPSYKFERYAGSSGAPGNVGDNYDMGDILFQPYDGSGLTATARIFGEVDGALGGGNIPVELGLGINPTGSVTAGTHDYLRIHNDGSVAINQGGSGSPDTLLHVGGRMAVNAGVKITTDPAACSGAADEGTIRYDSGNWEYCDGSDWTEIVTSETTASVSGCTSEAVIYDLSIGQHTCALYSNGHVACWGQNDDEQTGSSGVNPVTAPTFLNEAIVENGALVQAAHSDYSAVIRKDGSAIAFGDASDGRLGIGASVSADLVPIDIARIQNWRQISLGKNLSCGVTDKNLGYCWGPQTDGELGNDTTTLTSNSPAKIHNLPNVVQIAAGSLHACALMHDRTVKCWGRNDQGELGNGTTTQSDTPVAVSTLANVVDIDVNTDDANNSEFSCALRQDGTIWCWGADDYGQLGNGATTGDQNTPVQVSGITDAVDIELGENHACALRENGTVWCWGDNSEKSLGDGTTDDAAEPVQVSGVTTAVKLATSTYRSSCAILNDGSAQCWGSDNHAQLGDGTATAGDHGTPVDVLNPLACGAAKYIFVTSTSYDGNLGGVSGADDKCQAHADLAGLPGTYLAWISDGTDTPDSRFNENPGIYKLTDETTIATDWADLIDGTLSTAIDLDESGNAAPSSAWTDVEDDGTDNTTNATDRCQNWTSNTSGNDGRRGSTSSTTSTWTSTATSSCDNTYALYCVQK